jgi:hypothetical protein
VAEKAKTINNNHIHYKKKSANNKININEPKIKSNLTNKKEFGKKKVLKSREKSKELDKYKTILKHSEKKSTNTKCISDYLLSFIKRIKTESDSNIQTGPKNIRNKKLFFNLFKNRNINGSKYQLSEEKEKTNKSKENEKKENIKKIRRLMTRQAKTILSSQNNFKGNYRKISSINYPSIKNNSNFNIKTNFCESKDNINNIISYTTLDSKYSNNILYSKSIDFQKNYFTKPKKLSLKMNPGGNKQKEIFNSPLNSINNLINDKNKKKNIRLNNMNMNSEDKNTLFNHRTSQNNFKTITKNDHPKIKYRNFHHSKITKKSCDLNHESQHLYKSKVLSKIRTLNSLNTLNNNALKNSNNLYLSIIENYSNSVDGNSNEGYSNNNLYNASTNVNKNELITFSAQDKKKMNNKKANIYKKIMNHRIQNMQKRKDKRINRNYKISTENNLPLTIRVDTSKFLSNFKGK